MAKPPPVVFRTTPKAPSGRTNVTRPRLSRTLGILTILYALSMIAYGLLSLSVVAFLPRLGGLLNQVQTEQMGNQVASRQRALQTLDEAEAKASTPEEKAQLKVDRLLLERSQPSPMPGTTIPGLGMFNDPAASRGLMIDTSLKLAINVLLLIAGIGLFRGTRWARSLTIGTSCLKIAALIILSIVSMRTVVQPVSRSWTADVEKMIAQSLGQADLPPETREAWPTYEASMKSSFTLAILLLGSFGLVFPIIILILLNRPRIRAELAPAPAASTTGVSLE